MSTEAQFDARFEDIARRSATGTLSAADQTWLAEYLLRHPEAQANLDWHQAFANRLDERVGTMPAMPGWARTKRMLRTAPASAPGILDRLSEWFKSSLGMPLNFQALAAALVLAQGGLIGVMLWQQRDMVYVDSRAGIQDVAPRGPLLRVSFRPEIREAELRKALAELGAEIVGGPGQIGVYIVRVPVADLNAAAERLRASGVVELVEIFEAKR